MNYPTPYGNSDSLALENIRLKKLVTELKTDRRALSVMITENLNRAIAAESTLDQLYVLAEEALHRNADLPSRMFNGEPFPALVSAQEILEIIG